MRKEKKGGNKKEDASLCFAYKKKKKGKRNAHLLLHSRKRRIRSERGDEKAEEEEQVRKKKKVPSHNIYLPYLALRPLLPIEPTNRITYPPFLCPDLFIEYPQPLGAVDSSVRQCYWIIFDDTLGMQGIRHVSGKFIELRTAYGTDGSGGGGCVCRGRSVCRMAGGGLESG